MPDDINMQGMSTAYPTFPQPSAQSMPGMTPVPTQGPMLTGTPESGGFLSKFFGTNAAGSRTIGGIPAQNLAAMLGQLGAAIAPRGPNGRDTSISRLNQAAAQLGQTHIMALAAQQQQKNHMAFLQELFKGRPDMAQSVSSMDFNKSLMGMSPDQMQGDLVSKMMNGRGSELTPFTGSQAQTGLESTGGNLMLSQGQIGLANLPPIPGGN